MIEYIFTQNFDQRVLKRAKELLMQGGILSFPTDTNWLLVCDVFCAEAVSKIYKAKQENPHHHFSLICPSIQAASSVAMISDSSFRWLKKLSPGPYTFIFEASKKIAKALKASHADHQVGIRIPSCKILAAIQEIYDGPLLSTNITPAMLGLEEGQEIYSILIEEGLGNTVSMILDPGETEFLGQSTILDLRVDGYPIVIRQGVGELPF